MDADGIPLREALLPPSARLLRTVLDYCSAHPYQGEPVDHLAGDPQIRHDGHGRILMARAGAPEIMFVSAPLLDAADPATLTFDTEAGVLTLHVLPEPLRYRVLYPATTSWALTCRLLDEADATATH